MQPLSYIFFYCMTDFTFCTALAVELTQQLVVSAGLNSPFSNPRESVTKSWELSDSEHHVPQRQESC